MSELTYDNFLTYMDSMGHTLRPYQEPIAREFFETDTPYYVLKAPRRTVKTWLSARIATFYISCGKEVSIIFPKEKQAIDQSGDEIRQELFQIFPDSMFRKKRATNTILKNGGSLKCMSGSEDAQIEGFEADLLIIDEAHRIIDSNIARIYPFIFSTQGRILAIGVGGVPASTIEQLSSDKDSTSKVVKPQQVLEYWEEYSSHMELLKRRMTEKEYKAHIYLEGLPESDQLFTNYQTYTELPSSRPEYAVVGIDWGQRVDQSVAMLLLGYETSSGVEYYVSDAVSASGPIEDQLQGKIVPKINEEWKWDYVVAETNALGAASLEMLQSYVPQALGKHVSYEWKSSTLRKVAIEIQRERIHFPEDDGAMKKELEEVSISYNADNKIQASHSDYLSALLMCFHGLDHYK